jgi:hypothetical protein
LTCPWCSKPSSKEELLKYWPVPTPVVPGLVHRLFGNKDQTAERLRREIFSRKNFFFTDDKGPRCLKTLEEIKKMGMTIEDLILGGFSLIDMRKLGLTMNILMEMGLTREHFTKPPFAHRDLHMMEYVDETHNGTIKNSRRYDYSRKPVDAIWLGRNFRIYPSILLKAGLTFDDLAQLKYSIQDFILDTDFGKLGFIECNLTPRFWFDHFSADKAGILAFKLGKPEWRTLRSRQPEWNQANMQTFFGFSDEELKNMGFLVSNSVPPEEENVTQPQPAPARSFFDFSFFSSSLPQPPQNDLSAREKWNKILG